MAAIIIPAILVPPARASDVGAVEAFLTSERSAHGLNGLFSCPDLQSYAAARAVEQATELRIWHAADLSSAVGGWLVLGEIVGRGTSIGAVNQAWSQSPSHVEKYLDPRFTEVGVATAMGADGWVYAAVIFRKPSATPCSGASFLGGTPPSPPAPAAAPPAPAPAPVAAPAPAPAPEAASPEAAPAPVAASAVPPPSDELADHLPVKLAASIEVTRAIDSPSLDD